MLTAFGSAAVGLMFFTYWWEERSTWFIALFAVGCLASAAYGFLIGSYPFGVIETVWAVVAVGRFVRRRRGAPRFQGG